MRTLLNRREDIGRQRARELTLRFGRELRIARVTAGLSQADLGRLVGVTQAHVSLVERGDRTPSWDVACLLAAATGSELGLRLFPAQGVSLRDSGQIAIAEAVAASAHPSWHVQVERPIGDGSRRAIDIALTNSVELVVGEIERGLVDFQAQYRAAALKRDVVASGTDMPVRLVLVVPPTRAIREVLAAHSQLLARVLPIGSPVISRGIRAGTPIGGDGILFVRAGRKSAVAPPRATR
jgi:transcriptional regulator with XRE-family HTH domain